VNKIISAAALSLVLAVGCAKKGNDASKNSSALDISAPPPVAYEPPPPQPVAQPVIYDSSPTPVAATPTPAPSTGGGTYTVQKGDTLYGIARQRYGDGKQWTRIAQANPGVQPQSLKVGQSLVIP
jgi:5'-nucleotidase